jgi:flagellar FliL protein
MLKKKKVMLALALPVLLFAGYTMTKPKPVSKEKIKGTVYQLPKDFLLNLSDGRYARLTVALVLGPGQSDGATAGAAASSESTVGTLPEEPLVREIITNSITNDSGEQLISTAGRTTIKHDILAGIRSQTDVKVEDVVFPDLTVQ